MKRVIQVYAGDEQHRVGMHNHGFLHFNRGQWRLAPAFDLNPFPDRARELKTWVSEETGPEATIEALLSAIAYFRIPMKRAKEILGEVEAAVARWRDLGRALGMTSRELRSVWRGVRTSRAGRRQTGVRGVIRRLLGT